MRSVITRRVALLATLTVVGVVASVAAAPSAPEPKWLAGLNGDHRQLFDSPDPGGGIPLGHFVWNSLVVTSTITNSGAEPK